jgi:hypothetical protein
MGAGLGYSLQGLRLPSRKFASTSSRTHASAVPGRFAPLRAMVLSVATLLWLPCGAVSQQTRPHGVANLTAAWQPVGPDTVSSATFGNLTGRVTALAVDPNDATGNTLYLGSTGGGVWKSTNAAGALSSATFAPLTDTLSVFSATAGSGVVPSLAIGALAVEPQANPVVLAGTGDPNDAADSYYGEGVLRSADGGQTWTLVQGSHDGANGNHSFIGLATAGLAFSSVTPTLVVAAMTNSPQSAVVNAATTSSIPGLYYSTDAGVTWQMSTIEDGTTIVQTPQPLGTGQVGNAATAVVWDAQRREFFAAVRGHGYYSSPDGVTWTRLANQPGMGMTSANCPVGVNGLGASTCPIFRGTLAVQPVTGDLYAFTVDANNLDQGLWQDLCNAGSSGCATAQPVFANRIDGGALEVGSGSTAITQGAYDLALAAVPSAANGTLLFAGTVDLYRCSMAAGSSSCSLRNTTNALDGCNAPAGVAPAQHALTAEAQASGVPILYLGNDGGLWRSLDGVAETGPVCASTDSTHFDNLNAGIAAGGSLAMVTGFAEDPTAAGTLIAGMGAIGSAGTGAASASLGTSWPQLSAGEGGYPLIDPVTSSNWYVTIGAGVHLSACTAGAACTAANFVSPATVAAAQVGGDAALQDAPNALDPANTSLLLVGTCRVWRGPAQSSAGWSGANALGRPLDGSSAPCTSASALVRSVAAGGPAATMAGANAKASQVVYAGMAGSLDGGGSIAGHLFVSMNATSATPVWTDTALPNVGDFDVSSVAVDTHDPTGGTVYATVEGFGVPLVYRSVNFGATWTNVTANLPGVPANALAVDPNDANTVYVAIDGSVYETQSVATCSAAVNCWSALGTALPNAPVVALAAAAAVPTGDGRLGMLRAATYGRGIWQTPLLTATAPAAVPAITVSPTSLTFAAAPSGTVSAAQTLTVTSSGNAPVVFGTATIAGEFTETDTCSGQTLAVGAICTFAVAFAPQATGARSGLLTIYANIPSGQATVALAGTGTAPAAIVLTPASLTFAATLVGQTTAAQTVTIANTGGTPATLGTPVVTGDFAITADTCGATLAASTACAVSVAFAPTASGTRSGTLSVTDSAGTQTAPLLGTGQAPATDTLTPASLAFGTQAIGTTSAAQQLTLTNAGDVALTLIADTVSAGDFSVTSACGTSLAAHAACAFTVTFAPTAVGARSATLTVTDQFRAQTVALTGTGAAPAGVSLTPVNLNFAATGVGLTSPVQAVTLTNNGGVALAISGELASTVGGTSSFVVAGTTCGTSLSAGAACTVSVAFAPQASGPLAGSLVLTDSAANAPQTVSLGGTGVDFTLTAAGPTTATLASGGTASYALALGSATGLTGTVAMSCAGAPANATCTVSPTTPGMGQTVPITVTVATGLARNVRPGRPFDRGDGLRDLVALAMLCPLAILLRRRRLTGIALVLCAAAVLGGGGCATSRYIPGDSSSSAGQPTPSGSYNLTVTGSAVGLTKTVGLTLVVQ